MIRSVVGSGSSIGKNTRITDCIIGGGYSILDQEDIRDQVMVSDTVYASSADDTEPTATPRRAAGRSLSSRSRQRDESAKVVETG
jgi:NDP-sugar pyrophosphorylase family protein